MRFSQKIKVILLLVILLAAVILGICKGSADISFGELFSQDRQQILHLRIARVTLGILVGAGLGICGVALQAILRNPLADPYLLGTSSGAGFGAVLALIFGLSSAYLPLFAFGGAILSIILVYNLAREGNKVRAQSLILSGVIVAIALSGLIVFLVSLSSDKALHGMMWWLLGSLQIYEYKLLVLAAVIVISGILGIAFLAQDLNAISIGEETAFHLGIEVETVKKILFVITSLVTGALVSISGMIGFVGLIIPHMMRLVVGPNHKILIPATCLSGAAFLVICDAFARSLFPPVEIPIGVITSLFGAPVFIILLKRRQKINL